MEENKKKVFDGEPKTVTFGFPDDLKEIDKFGENPVWGDIDSRGKENETLSKVTQVLSAIPEGSPNATKNTYALIGVTTAVVGLYLGSILWSILALYLCYQAVKQIQATKERGRDEVIIGITIGIIVIVHIIFSSLFAMAGYTVSNRASKKNITTEQTPTTQHEEQVNTETNHYPSYDLRSPDMQKYLPDSWKNK